MRNVIFDLDGTLMDTSGDLVAAANSRFRDLGLGDLLDPVADAGIALRGGRAMLRAGFARVDGYGEEEVDRQYRPLLDAYAQDLDSRTTIYPGAMEAVEALISRGYRVGICTNKPEALADELLRRKGVREVFAAVLGADTLPVRKPDPEHLRETSRRAGGDPARACLVGDTDTDRNTARAAGVPSILVTFGPAGAEMPALRPEVLLDDYARLVEVVERLAL
ncbi:HAD-IA family hydrolase [Ponticoccus sp. SC2-23]|uniref:HAD-IA family hydrolase n=1 Tax=Alexandriicola marinus TaxID=2081710 RepID=UPI000FDB326F|nr:HAD-IA family hydrolase [Alexandriicola marinus]MBM1219428.1 HAD-IA family hydrolase [Ponticoccus sp. SC6-9]MBM1223500.1 HAD-IA family hydrolase [Ponticoccus sp. SC6-15]MBM1229241.1 HAD-IA family hydrolase [Ponticoccus sp. SC6-38]MBM1232466.1 HAD-IA family hydrolase [Ponticoccus sp. SC6-45]MBM1237584.1 HAD-IA family hydrolase [Ponticoccus sp. SC6-49]MBM1241477.1 HAD-IA family hydrolase [Ponticoccus sp. SC2-64]MBM1245990.1 HAD-IA family hydrolase [Ponticoccus sp. SC6-42]MBM1250468.1 HAD-I